MLQSVDIADAIPTCEAMFDRNKPFTFDRVVRLLLTASIFLGVFLLVRCLSDVLIPFVAAAVLAYILNPLIVVFQHKLHLRRGTAVALTFVGGLLISFAVFVIVALISVQQMRQVDQSWRNFRTGAISWIASQRPASQPATTTVFAEDDSRSWLGLYELSDGLTEFFQSRHATLEDRLDALNVRVEGTAAGVALREALAYVSQNEDPAALFSALANRLAMGGITIKNVTVEVFLGLTAIVLVMIYLVFILLDYPRYRDDWRNLVPLEYRTHVLGFLTEFDAVLRRYFRGQFIIAMLTGVLFAIGFTLIGLPMAIPFGLFVGALNMVPYLQLVAFVPAIGLVLLKVLSGEGELVSTLLLLLVVFGVVQLIQDALLTPKIMGKSVGLSPVAVILGVFIWGKLLGFLGLILAIPLTCLGIAYYRRLVLQHSMAETTLTVAPS